ncbi:MAG TPA: VCBS repeat-containing protein [Planctomycetota bacterium]|nr:VCBS repeat-containing protein [Planctomycetota bacterium]
MASNRNLAWSAAAAVAFFGFGGTAQAQLLVEDNTGNPTGVGVASSTENVDFADVDLDGDWDAVFADGGDDGNDQNRIWINRGGLQAGPLGDFLDQTSTRFPQQVDDSRDIEFADIDNDGDHDLYVSNTAQLSNQGNKWWVNNGFAQGGTLGFYTDETAQRWINLGGPGSSIAPSLVTQGTFIDWSCDCDFGDLDNDGDLDLVHSTYGGAFGGNVPSRVFLNDGTGHFAEFNPGGGQLTGNNISNGQPAIWAEGVQQGGTTNTTGAFADIATSALDIDVGDIDGDFDLDILHGSRQDAPRMFKNRLQENGGTLGFRDVTGATFPPGYWTSGDNYEQEMGDLDKDGDLDIYGLNWPGFNDATYRNDGNGVYVFLQSNLTNSGSDDNEGDFGDFNNDGNLDLFVANFSGSNRMYLGSANGTLTLSEQGLSNGTSLDADLCDIDNDGDLDVIVAQDNNAANDTLFNQLNQADTWAPYIPNVENIASGSATAAPDVLRAQVYDNRPYYITWYHETNLLVVVDGFDLPSVPMHTSQGNIFRATMPGNLLGLVQWRVRSTDEVGNLGQSATKNYTNTTGLAIGGTFGSGTAGGSGVPSIEALSVAFPNTMLHIGSGNLGASVPYAIGLTGAALPFTVGAFNITTPIILIQAGVTNAQGEAVMSVNVLPGFSGLSVFAQSFGIGQAPFGGLSSSPGLEIVLQ